MLTVQFKISITFSIWVPYECGQIMHALFLVTLFSGGSGYCGFSDRCCIRTLRNTTVHSFFRGSVSGTCLGLGILDYPMPVLWTPGQFFDTHLHVQVQFIRIPTQNVEWDPHFQNWALSFTYQTSEATEALCIFSTPQPLLQGTDPSGRLIPAMLLLCLISLPWSDSAIPHGSVFPCSLYAKLAVSRLAAGQRARQYLELCYQKQKHTET